MDGLLLLAQRGGAWAVPQPAQAPPRCPKCNSPHINGQCTELPITVLLYSGPLLCGFSVPIKGLKEVKKIKLLQRSYGFSKLAYTLRIMIT